MTTISVGDDDDDYPHFTDEKMEVLRAKVSGHTVGESGPLSPRSLPSLSLPAGGLTCISREWVSVAVACKLFSELFPPLPGHRAGLHLPASLARETRPFW